jgi:hypothetical protein
MPELRLSHVIILGLLGLAALGWVAYRRRQLRGTVLDRFRVFREQAVHLMDRLDELRQRHKTMTSTDPDFEVPMAGATRALYEQVDQDLDRLWERWLGVMEVWNRAQERLTSGFGLAAGPIEEARALLERGDIEALVRETGDCQKRLDRLNQAHERAREELHEVRHELASVQHEVTGGTGILLPTDRHHATLENAERALADAERRVAADPIGAEELILHTRSDLAGMTALPEWRPARPAGDMTFQKVFEELAAAAERLRSTVFRFWSTSVLGLFVRAWLALVAVSFFFVILLPLFPLGLFFLMGLVMLLVFGAIVRAQLNWFGRFVSGSIGDRTGPLGRDTQRP